MAQTLTGTWEEIKTHEAELAGHQVSVTVLDGAPGRQPNHSILEALREEIERRIASSGDSVAIVSEGRAGHDVLSVTPALNNDSTAGNELVASAWRIYNERLKAILEPEHLGKVVAIQPDSFEYEVASNSPTARRELRKRYPTGPIVTIRIGVVNDDNPLSLRARNALRGLRS